MVYSCTEGIVSREWTLRKCLGIGTFLDLLPHLAQQCGVLGTDSVGVGGTVVEQSFGVFLNSGVCSLITLGLATTVAF